MSSTLSSLRQLRFLLTKKEKQHWLKMGVFAITGSILELITALSIVIFARSLNQPSIALDYLHKVGFTPNWSSTTIILYMSIFIGITYLVKNVFVSIETFHQNFSIQKMQHRCENSLLARYSKMDYSLYLTRNSSYGLSSIKDVEEIFSRGVVALANIFSEGFIFVCLIGMVIYMNPSLAIIIFLSGFIFYYLGVKFVFPRFYHWGKVLQAKDLLCQKSLLQFFHSFKEIILLGKQDAFFKAYSKLSEDKTKIQAVIRATNNLPRNFIEIFFMGLFIFVVCYLCLQKQTSQAMLGTLAGYLYVGFRLMPGLNRVITHYNVFKTSLPHIDRVYRESLSEGYNGIESNPAFHFKQSIKLNNLSFKHKQSEKMILSKINLTILKGECIGIIGETGSGKSTLIDIILGLLKPVEGNILIDDQFQPNTREWHQQIGYVPQIIYLMDDTIAANIAYGETEEEIDLVRLNQAIDDAQLRKFVDSLPLKSQSIVGDRGIRLSGGERQRIAIARALYRHPTILIFDEATSALDSSTEVSLMETLQMVRKNRTVIMVAHRLTTLKNCDRIIVIKDNSIHRVTDYKELSASLQFNREKQVS